MSEAFTMKMSGFVKDVAAMTRATARVGWTDLVHGDDDRIGEMLTKPEDIKGRAIDAVDWARALSLGLELGKLRPSVPAPLVGAHPDGFPTLTWIRGENNFLDLQLRPRKETYPFRWGQRTSSGESLSVQSDSFDDVAEAFRTVFAVDA